MGSVPILLPHLWELTEGGGGPAGRAGDGQGAQELSELSALDSAWLRGRQVASSGLIYVTRRTLDVAWLGSEP